MTPVHKSPPHHPVRSMLLCRNGCAAAVSEEKVVTVLQETSRLRVIRDAFFQLSRDCHAEGGQKCGRENRCEKHGDYEARGMECLGMLDVEKLSMESSPGRDGEKPPFMLRQRRYVDCPHPQWVAAGCIGSLSEG